MRGLQFQLQGVEFSQRFFLMKLGGSDMVLGMDWLASLGNIEANFGELCLKWKQGGQKYSIQGDPALCTRQASWKAMLKALTDEGMGFYLHSMEAKQAGNNTKTPEWERILELLKKYLIWVTPSPGT